MNGDQMINAPVSSNNDVAGIESGKKWNTTTVTYDDDSLGSKYAAQVDGLISYAGTVSDLKFVKVDNSATADINIQFVQGITGGNTVYNNDDTQVTIQFQPLTNAGFDIGDATNGNADNLLHELGHAVGLKHPFDGSGALGGNKITLPSNLDNTDYTLMSYTHSSDKSISDGLYSPGDISALQDLYGAPAPQQTVQQTSTVTPVAQVNPFLAMWAAMFPTIAGSSPLSASPVGLTSLLANNQNNGMFASNG